ncbi:hypothetical protein [Streptomyces sp. ME19-01-6]|uniref:hypothetical protein n=1 Tax=Streptomyces sp. ME19-01-6 TaxID=3028686 RepID=UPI0029CA9D13|nr:hypothetical protein [Streptomyces sp. ME19-01-6]
MRFLELRRSGHTPTPTDFDHDFPALVARTLSDLTPDERHVLRSVSLLDAFDLALATRAAGMTHEAPAMRLVERPFVRENRFGLWPFHLHGLIRSTIRNADDQADDRWSPNDWAGAAERAFGALGEQWSTSAQDRLLLIGCLRQGLRLARDSRLGLGWLAGAAWSYVGDSIWEPLAPPTPNDPAATGLETAADALVETLSTLGRRQHEHRERTIDRLTAVIDTGLLPTDLHEMAVYYRPRPNATSAAPRIPAAACSWSPTAPAASPPRPAAAWPTSPPSPATSPPHWPPPALSAGPAATTASKATCGGPKPTWSARPPRMKPPALRRNSTASPGSGPPHRPSAPSSSPSPTRTRPTTNSNWPSSSLPG